MMQTSTSARRIGVFGGTFDPIHLGHLVLAELCREAGRLDEVWFVPAGNNPFKPGRYHSFDQRAEMVELAIAGQPAFRVERVEKDMVEAFLREHPNAEIPKTYTYQMLAELHRRHPTDELYFLIGSDSLDELPTWMEPQQILLNAGLLVMVRPGSVAAPMAQLRADLGLPEGAPLRIEFVPSPPLIDIASSSLRERVSRGDSIRYLVPRSVECYIADKHLYTSESVPASARR